MTPKDQAQALSLRFPAIYPDAHCELIYDNPLQLLIATILSAQCTDKRVNQVTPALFERCPTAQAYAEIEPNELETLIHTTGFFRNKAKHIRATAAILAERYHGEVPADLDILCQLPGIGRKTANVVLSTAYGLQVGIAVDTHVRRLSQRLGLTTQTDPNKIEQDLQKLFDQKQWSLVSHWLIFHGRRRCFARKPDCAACELRDLCPSVL